MAKMAFLKITQTAIIKGSSFAAAIQNSKESVRYELSDANELIYKINKHVL